MVVIYKIDEEIERGIQDGWMKCRNSSSVICNGKVSLKLKRTFIRAMGVALLY